MIMFTVEYIENNMCCLAIPEQQGNQIRDSKVLEIRNEIWSGRYNPESHLDVVVDRLLEEILNSEE